MSDVRDVSVRLAQVEDRLTRLLASGWRNANAEAIDLQTEADALAEIGLVDLAERVRRVARAGGAREALPAIALALSGCRLVRARLPVDDAPPGRWTPLVTTPMRSAAAADQLLPVGRVVLANAEEVWACARLNRGVASDLVLVTPLPFEVGATEAVEIASGFISRLIRGQKRASDSDDDAKKSKARPPWLRSRLRGRLRWLGRLPLGAGGEVQRCDLEDANWSTPKVEEDSVRWFRTALTRGKLDDGQIVVTNGGHLRVKQLDASEAGTYLWPDSATEAAFRAIVRDRHWAVAWVQGAIVVPLVLVVPGDRRNPPRLIHLVPGAPEEVVGE